MTTLPAEIAQERANLAELREVRPVDVEIAQAQLEKAKIAVEQQQANLEDAQVRAPIAGQILRINTRIGEQVNTSRGIVELARTDQMFALAEVAETDIGKVRKGQRAIITSEYGGFTGAAKGTALADWFSNWQKIAPRCEFQQRQSYHRSKCTGCGS